MVKGPLSYQNWNLYLSGKQSDNSFEVPLYSDVSIGGQVMEGLGPYKILNAQPSQIGDEPAAVLVVKDNFELSKIDFSETTTSSFSGVSLADEIAVLISLCLGIRIRAGGITREIKANDAPDFIRGDYEKPLFFHPRRFRGHYKHILPRATQNRLLDLDLLKIYPQLSPDLSLTLVRSARSYRDALWIAEVDPNLAWLLLVTSIEVVAVYEQRRDKTSLDILRECKVEFSQKLRKISPQAEELVADEFSGTLKSTARFLSFMQKYLPDPPMQRPPVAFQLNWTWDNLKKILPSVYNYRSKALHDSVPFPSPMSRWPDKIGKVEENIFSEIITGEAASSDGGVWTKEDLPLSLHMFEYMVRGALIQWWKGLGKDKS